jgi:cytochrome b6-f complex iron-sulfur subunit
MDRLSMAAARTSRRRFLTGLWAALGGLAVVETAAVVVGFFRPRAPRGEVLARDPVIVAGPVERFEPGSVQAFVQGRFYLARLENGGFLALSRNCTHLNCSVPWNAEEKRFVCPCHASAFDIRGEVVSPPAPRALDLFAVDIENGMVLVDTSRRSRRQAFAAEQVTYPPASRGAA